jgi:SAM-dependent methyltransferase
MSIFDFHQLFGDAASWVAGAVLLILGVLLVAAFVQNRELSMWPPRIGARAEPVSSRTEPVGSRPEMAASRAESVGRSRRPGGAWSLRRLAETGSNRDVAGYDEVFEVDRADVFYSRIAAVYDGRNSRDLVATHLATIGFLQTCLVRRPALRVLDLGGGTGNPIATHFFDEQSVEWTYVDVCAVLAGRFQQSLENHPLGRNMIVQTDNLNHAVRRLPAGRYDVVVLSLVLTSMPALPDFSAIARVLAPGGALVVTDIGPGYTALKPYYEVYVDDQLLALHTEPVDPVEVSRRATAAGLVLTELAALGDDTPYYSFICTFTAPSRPPAQT